jgi:hypothetical protein
VSQIVVTPLEPTRFGVAVSEGQVTTHHKVAVPEQLVDDLGLGDVDPALIVREAFAFLLDREPAAAIQGDFPIDQIADRYPQFYEELQSRLGV